MSIMFKFMNSAHVAEVSKWQHDPEISSRIAIDNFDEWYEHASGRLDYLVWVAYEGTDLVGVVTAEVTIYKKASIAFMINPARRIQGYGKRVVKQMIRMKPLLEIEQLEAWVDRDNVGSIKCLENSGFKREANEQEEVPMLFVFNRDMGAG